MGTVIIDVHATTIYLPKLHHKPKFEKFVEEIICFSKFELFVFCQQQKYISTTSNTNFDNLNFK